MRHGVAGNPTWAFVFHVSIKLSNIFLKTSKLKKYQNMNNRYGKMCFESVTSMWAGVMSIIYSSGDGVLGIRVWNLFLWSQYSNSNITHSTHCRHTNEISHNPWLWQRHEKLQEMYSSSTPSPGAAKLVSKTLKVLYCQRKFGHWREFRLMTAASFGLFTITELVSVSFGCSWQPCS